MAATVASHARPLFWTAANVTWKALTACTPQCACRALSCRNLALNFEVRGTLRKWVVDVIGKLHIPAFFRRLWPVRLEAIQSF